MKPIRRAVLPVLIGMMLFVFSASALSADLWLEAQADGVLKEGRLFYISVIAKEPLEALNLSVSFDENAAEYKGVTASTSHTVRGTCQDGSVSVIYSDAEAHVGTLFTLKFKAVISGKTDIILSPLSAVKAGGTLIELSQSDGISVSVGAGASSVTAVEKGSRSSSKKMSSSQTARIGESSADEALSTGNYDFPRFSARAVIRIVLIAVGLVVIIIVSVMIGIRLGRKKPPRFDHSDNKED